MRKVLALAVFASVILLSLFSTGAFPAPASFTVRQLTTNGVDDYGPRVSGDRVVWYAPGGADAGDDFEIFTWTPVAGTVQLTANSSEDHDPRVSDVFVTWVGAGGVDRGWDDEVFIWSPAGGTVQLTANGGEDYGPRVSGDRVVWYGSGGSDGGEDTEIFTWAPATGIAQLTRNNTGDYDPQVAGNRVVWIGIGGTDGGGDWEIFSWTPATGVVQLTANNTGDYDPQVSDDRVVWVGSGGTDGGGDWEIFTWTPATGVAQLTSNGSEDYDPVVSGDRVAWVGAGLTDGGDDREIFTWTSAGGTVQLTGNTTGDYDPQVSAGLVVWTGEGGIHGEAFPGLEQGEPFKLPTSSADDSFPHVSGGRVVWVGLGGADGGDDWEIFTALASSGPRFSDVDASHPYYLAIEDLARRGVISGHPDGTFRPGNPVIRQQFAKMIVKTLGYPVSEADISPFVDVAQSKPGAYVDPSDPNYPDHYIAVCAAYGITRGRTPTTFAPYDNITRQQLITMVARAAGLPDPPAGYTPPFSPAQFYPQEHYLNARKAAYAGLLDGLQGVGPGYDFLASAGRGECAQLLHNLTLRDRVAAQEETITLRPLQELGPVIGVVPGALDFGEVVLPRSGRESIEIRNGGFEFLVIYSISLRDGAPFALCGAPPTPLFLQPGAAVVIDACFNPAQPGVYEDQITILSNDPFRPGVAVPVYGDAVPQDTPAVNPDLDVDYSRDGTISVGEPDDPKEDEDIKYIGGKGALVLANLDDDAGEKKVDKDDDVITSVKDQEDFSKLIARQIVLDPEQGWTAFLEITQGWEHVRIFREFGKGARGILGLVRDPDNPDQWVYQREYKIPNADLAKGDVNFFIEGISPAEQVTIELRVYQGPGEQPKAGDVVKMLVTPLIFHPNTHKTDRIFYSRWTTFAKTNGLFTAGFQPEAQKLLGDKVFPIGLATGTFVQDVFEIGYQMNPANHAGAKIVMPTAVDLPWKAGKPTDYPKEELLKPDFGFLKVGDETDDTGGDYGGNVETIPEFQSDLPYGHLVIGDNVRPTMREFLLKQKVQAKGETKLVILPIDPQEGSTVFHVDEVINVIPSAAGKRFKVVIGDLDMAIDLLKKHVGGSSATVLKDLKAKYTDAGNKDALDRIRSRLSKIREILKTEAGLADGDIVPLPVLYPLAFGAGYGLPNAINLQVIDAKVFVPSPVYEKAAGAKGRSKELSQMLTAISKQLKDAGVNGSNIVFVDTSEMSGLGGEAHCATNADRRPPQ